MINNAEYYGIVGYENVASGALPRVATPHIINEQDDHFTLCGRRCGYKLPRNLGTDRGYLQHWAKKVCAQCAKKSSGD